MWLCARYSIRANSSILSELDVAYVGKFWNLIKQVFWSE